MFTHWVLDSEVIKDPTPQAADDDKDGSLSYDEVLNNYNVFVGSQATDYGRSLHEEL